MADIKRNIIAIIMAVLIAASSALIVSTVNVDAATKGSANSHATQKMQQTLAKQTSKLNVFAKSYAYKVKAKTSKRVDFIATAKAKNIKTTYSFDSKAHKVIFKMTGKSYGLTDYTLKYRINGGKWEKTSMKLFVDSDNNIMRIK